jgi:hypothetical protein
MKRPMRPIAFLGLLLVLLGGFALFRGLSYSSNRAVLKIGEFQASVEEKRSVPPWAGGLAVAAGLVLLGLSVRKRP